MRMMVLIKTIVIMMMDGDGDDDDVQTARKPLLHIGLHCSGWAICHNTIEPIAREARFARVANTLRLDRGDQTQEKKIFRQLKVLIFAKAKC